MTPLPRRLPLLRRPARVDGILEDGWDCHEMLGNHMQQQPPTHVCAYQGCIRSTKYRTVLHAFSYPQDVKGENKAPPPTALPTPHVHTRYACMARPPQRRGK